MQLFHVRLVTQRTALWAQMTHNVPLFLPPMWPMRLVAHTVFQTTQARNSRSLPIIRRKITNFLTLLSSSN